MIVKSNIKNERLKKIASIGKNAEVYECKKSFKSEIYIKSPDITLKLKIPKNIYDINGFSANIAQTLIYLFKKYTDGTRGEVLTSGEKRNYFIVSAEEYAKIRDLKNLKAAKRELNNNLTFLSETSIIYRSEDLKTNTPLKIEIVGIFDEALELNNKQRIRIYFRPQLEEILNSENKNEVNHDIRQSEPSKTLHGR